MTDPAATYRVAEAEWFVAVRQFEKDSPEFLAAYAKYRTAGRASRNHYAAIGEKAFGRI